MKNLRTILRFKLMLMLIKGQAKADKELNSHWLLIAAMRRVFVASIRVPASAWETREIAKILTGLDRAQGDCFPLSDRIFAF